MKLDDALVMVNRWFLDDVILEAPGNFTIVSKTYNEVNLAWDSVSDAYSYIIERSFDGANWTTVGSPTANSFKDDTVESETTYYYRVKAARGVTTSEYSDEAQVTTDSAPLASPMNLMVVSKTHEEVNLTWDSVSDADSYIVERSSNVASWAMVGSPTTNSFKDTAVDAEATYHYRVKSVRGAVTSNHSAEVQVTTEAVPLASPTNLVVSSKTYNEINLAWDAVSSAVSYIVERSFDGTDWLTVGQPTINSFKDTAVQSETTYHYRVGAVRGATTSAYSNAVQGVTDAAPLASPTNLAVSSKTYNEVNLTWNSVADAVSYILERSLNGSDWLTVGEPTINSFKDNTVESETTYHYRVKAVRGATNSAYSNEIQATTDPAPLASPANLTVLSKTYNEINLTWSLVADAVSYILERSLDGTNWETVGSPTANSFKDNTVESETTYHYRVAAVRGVTTSAHSNEVQVATDPAPLASPDNLTVSSKTYNEINLTWNSVADAASYIVERSFNGADWAAVGEPTINSFKDNIVESETTYHYRVKAVRGVTTSAYSNEIQATTDPAPLAAPTNLAVLSKTYNEINLTWNSVADAVSYILERSVDGTNWATVGEPIANSFKDGTVESETTYHYRVKAVRGVTTSVYSNEIQATTDPAPLASPTSLTVSSKTYNEINLTWNSVADAVSYAIERSLNGMDWTTVGQVTVDSFKDDTVQSETTYHYRVAAIRGVTTSAYSNEIQATTDPAPLASPTNLTVSSKTYNEINLTWNSVVDAVSYILERSVDGTNWATVGEPTVNSFKDDTVESETTYHYRVKAVRGVTTSEYSNEAQGTTDPAPLASPTNLVISSHTYNEINLTWNSVVDAVSYIVERSLNGTDWSMVGSPTANSFKDNTVESETTYHYRVKAVRGVTTSEYSNEVQGTTDAAPLAAPTSFAISSKTHEEVNLTWSLVSDADSYIIDRSLDGTNWVTVGEPTANSFKDDTVESETTYHYRVAAVRGVTTSEYSNEVQVTTEAAPLASPMNLTVSSNTHEEVNLTWDSVSDAVSYILERSVNGMSWSMVGEPTTNSFKDDTVESETTYHYRVAAVRGATTSEYSNEVQVTTEPAPLA